MIRPEFVPGIDATVDEIPPTWQDGAVGESPGELHVGGVGDERIDLDVDVRRATLLVLNDSFFPGWEARVDGSPATIHQRTSSFVGLFLAPGHRRVEFSYEPRSFVIVYGSRSRRCLFATAVGAGFDPA